MTLILKELLGGGQKEREYVHICTCTYVHKLVCTYLHKKGLFIQKYICAENLCDQLIH